MPATVRTFRAADAASALRAVKAAFGSEAVIVSTQEVAGGLFRSPEIEVTASVSDELAQAVARAKPPPLASRPLAEPAFLSQPAPPAPRPLSLVSPPRPPDESGLAHEVLSLKKELEEARREMRVVCLQTRGERELSLTPPQAELYGRLVNQGVEESLAEEMLRQAAYDAAQHRRPVPLESVVKDLIAGRLIPGRAPWSQDGRRVVALVGPTGVGKTTTLAKIAAKAIVESRLRVALITVDTYRIGGSEQLSRYGKIMRVPTYVAKDGAELATALARCPSADLILVDTSGRAVSEAVYRQAEMLRQMAGVALHLVLSAATGARELAAVAERYRPLMPERLIFSKIDEAVAPGSVLSAAVRINRPVACVTDGQRVPEDIHSVTSEELTSLAMGTWQPLQAGATAGRR